MNETVLEIIAGLGLFLGMIGIIFPIIWYNISENKGYFKRDIQKVYKKLNLKEALNIIFRIDFYYDEKTKEQRFIFEFHLGKLWFTLVIFILGVYYMLKFWGTLL